MSGRVKMLLGCLWGGAVGDAIGLPYEGLSLRRSRRFARLPLKHRFIFSRGMVSDDTDHSVFVAQALLRSAGDPARFRTVLAWRLRLWLLCLPAGIGMATLKSILRLWLGIRPTSVFSAGNGPAMRSAIIGAFFADDASARRAHIEASTLLTHTDPLALSGALAVAEIAAHLASGRWPVCPSLTELVPVLRDLSSQAEWLQAVQSIRECCETSAPLSLAEQRFGSRKGVSGYVLHSVPFAIVVWHRYYDDYRSAIEAVTQAGGDVDTVAAIAGALVGMSAGPDGIPEAWRNGLMDWPHSLGYLRQLAAGLADPDMPVATGFSPWLFVRGIIFTILVLAHGLRRLLPPY
jgi:ADP-ribosyl-[dinitrogen reductase] hydrolase